VRLTEDDLERHGLDLRTFTHELQSAGRTQPVPKFTLKGPIQLIARMRPRGAAPADCAAHNFIGGEKFTLGAVQTETSDQDGTTTIRVLMSAASVTLAAAGVTSATVPLDFAMEHFEGLEQVVLRCTADSMRSKHLPVPALIPAAAIPVKPTAAQEARRGSW
jgi:hypothetical protein